MTAVLLLLVVLLVLLVLLLLLLLLLPSLAPTCSSLPLQIAPLRATLHFA